MKKIYIVLTITLLVVSPLIGGAFLDFLNGRSDGENITLEWKTRSESNLQMFKVERRAINQNDYASIADIQAKGSNSYYTFVDRAAYKASETVYVYRLKIIDQDPSAPPSYSYEVRVSHSVSSVKRTWGSIKAMFR